jgi:hypothetical protein
MAAALLGYFGTMVAALAGLMLLLNSFLTSPYMDRPRPYPRPAVEIEQTVAAAPASGAPITQTHATNVEVPDSASSRQAAAEKSRHLKVARSQIRRGVAPRDDLARNNLARNDLARKEDSAGRRQDQEYSTALGYAHDAQQQAATAPLFDSFQPGHF